MSNLQKGKGSTASPPAVANRGQQPNQRGPTPPNRGQEDYSSRNSQGYQQGGMPPVMFQGMIQPGPQQGQQQRLPPQYYRGVTHPIRMPHAQTANHQPMFPSPTVPMVPLSSGGGPQQYAVSPQQYSPVDYQVPNQPMAYRSPAPPMTGYNQVQYQNYSASASMPPPMFVRQPQPQNVYVRMPPIPPNIPGPPPYPQSRPEQHASAPRKKNYIKIRDPNQDNKDVTEEILSQSATNLASGSPGPASESTLPGQSSTSNTPPQENASKNSESLGSVFAAQVAATLTVGSDSTKKTKPIITHVVMPSHMAKSTSPKAIHPEVKIISIIDKKNSRPIEKEHKKDDPKIEAEKPEVKPAIIQPKKSLDTEDSITSVVDSAKNSTEAKSEESTEVNLENQINANKAKAIISNETVPLSASVDSKTLTNEKPNIATDVSPSIETETKLSKEQLGLESQEHKIDTENLPNGSISPLTVSEEICQELETIPPSKDIPKSDVTTSKEGVSKGEVSKEEDVSEVQIETSSDTVAKASQPMAQANNISEEGGTVNGVESQKKAKQTAAPPTTELSMKENKRKKLVKRLKEIDKKPAQADILDAFTEAPPPKEVVKEEPKEEKKEEKEEQVASEEETWEDKDEKSEEMWEPEPEPEVEENKNGPRFYDRDFLLQFQFNPICTEKPDGLPDIEVVLQTPVSHRPQLKQPYANRMGGGGGVDFMPSFMRQSRGMGSGQSMPRSNKGRMPAKKVIHTIEQKVELNKSENRWVRPAESSKNLNEEEKKTEDILRKFRGILNKLTPQKFETLIRQVLDLEIDTPERLEYVINIIFEKAISEPGFSVAYANMCRCLIPTNVKVETKDGKDTTLTFRKILLNKCQKEFEKEKTDEINIHSKMDELLKQGLSDEELKIKKDELDEEELKGRRRTLGNIRFIGELFKLKMLTESIMHDCIIKLLKSNDEESYECLCKLLSTIGKDLDHPKAKPRMDQYFDKVHKIIEAKKTSSRCRFMLQDVTDLRDNNWVPRRDDNNPKTIDQIHKEAAEEEKKTMMLIQQTKLPKRDGLGKGRDGSRLGGVPQADEAWTTVPARQRNVSVDPKKFQDVKKRTNVDTESISLGPGGRGFGAWARGSSGGSGPSSGPSAPTEEPRGNRYSALGGEGRRGPGVSRQGSGAGRQESRGQGQGGRRPQSEKEKALEAVRTVVQTKGPQPSRQEGRQTPSPRPDEELVAPFTRRENTPTPPPKLTEEEVESKTMGLIHEYHNIKDIKEAIQCVKDINCPEMHYKFVYFALNHSMEKHASERVLTAELLHALLQRKIVTEESYIKGLEEVLEFAEDMEIDIPHIWKYLGELIGVTITANVLSLTSLNKSIEKYIRDKSKAAKLMAETLLSARCGLDPKEIDLLWVQSGLSFSKYFSSEEEEIQFLKSNKLESLAGGSSSTSTQSHSSKVQEELRHLILIKKSNNEVVFSWIEAHVKDTKDPKFIRALVTVICESCKKDGDDSCDLMAFKQKSPLLQKYIDNNTSLEVQALFALQALSANLDHPPGFLKSFFNALYDEEAISEEAFFAWEEDTSPSESHGKGTAKASTVHFFEWLRSAEEEKPEET